MGKLIRFSDVFKVGDDVEIIHSGFQVSCYQETRPYINNGDVLTIAGFEFEQAQALQHAHPLDRKAVDCDYIIFTNGAYGYKHTHSNPEGYMKADPNGIQEEEI